jgi:ATP-dependent helicase/nuclease subunit B
VDERELRDFLLGQFDVAMRARFGDRLTLPLVIQQESARQRIGKLATVQARERAAGWVIERMEWAFTLDIAGLHVRGKIDRIDQHEVTGARRVLDYKTADTAVPPHKSHLRPYRAADGQLPEWMRVDVNGREYVWADLQLPVYLRALAGELGGTDISCGYVNLPKAASETGVALWPELSEFLLEKAHQCTDEVAGKIRAGEFWPPAEIDPERDAFASLFHHGAEDSVEWKRANGASIETQAEPSPGQS